MSAGEVLSRYAPAPNCRSLCRPPSFCRPYLSSVPPGKYPDARVPSECIYCTGSGSRIDTFVPALTTNRPRNVTKTSIARNEIEIRLGIDRTNRRRDRWNIPAESVVRDGTDEEIKIAGQVARHRLPRNDLLRYILPYFRRHARRKSNGCREPANNSCFQRAQGNQTQSRG